MSEAIHGGVIIADPQRMFVDTMVSAVQAAGMHAVQLATTRAGLVTAVRRHPGVLCLTAWTFGDGGLAEVMPQIRTVSPESRIVVVSDTTDPQALSGALNIGVQGFIHTSRGLDVLLRALSRVRAGEVVIETSLMGVSPASTNGDGLRARNLARLLTPREYECLAMVADGLDTAAMSRRLGVSRTTIRSHVQAMLVKLHVHSRLEAAALAVQHDLLQPRSTTRFASGL